MIRQKTSYLTAIKRAGSGILVVVQHGTWGEVNVFAWRDTERNRRADAMGVYVERECFKYMVYNEE